jgi:two-component system chemotaxis response regulator CheB
MPKDIVVLGGSTGGLDAMRSIVGQLSKDFRGSLFVVLHTAADSPGVLGAILERAGALPAYTVRSQERIQPGAIYVPAPDHHLVLEPGLVCATRGPKENRFRPAVDPLFRSAAQVYGPRAIGVILTGGLDDGTAGLWAIKQLGGTAIVQDPEDALVTSMPKSALSHVRVDHCIPLQDIAPLLMRLTTETATEEGIRNVSESLQIEVNIAKEDRALEAGVLTLGEPSNYTCPECHGVLLQLKEENRIRFRCHTGHAYSAESLLAHVEEAIGDALWNAIRSLEEGVMLLRHFEKHLTAAGQPLADEFRRRAEAAEQQGNLVRRAAVQYEPGRAVEGLAKG